MPSSPLSGSPGISRVIEKQMRNWEISRAQHKPPVDSHRPVVRQFVTIANIVGAGGREVATLLAEKLGWPVFDRELLTTMAGDDQVRARIYGSMDERDLGWIEDTLRTLMQHEYCKNDYFHRLTATVLGLARQGPAVFVGRSADLILPKETGLRVRIIAPRALCVEKFARYADMSTDRASEEVDRVERERCDFVKHHFHVDQCDMPMRFDLQINAERFTVPQAVDLILAAMPMRGVV